MRILIPGASGLLGINLALEAYQQNHTVIGTYCSNILQNTPFDAIYCDLTQSGEIEHLLESTKPDLVINCAALAKLDLCETQPELASKLNVALPAQLADKTRNKGVKYIHISTDAVFDGQKECYSEADSPNPINVYAQTKFAGELEVASKHPEALIARVNIFGWSVMGKRSLAEWFFTNLLNNKPIKGFSDVYFCPLFVNDLAKILLSMADNNLHGLYHVVGGNCLTKYEFGIAIARQFNFNESLITPASWKTGDLTAMRSSSLCLKIDKLISDLGIPAPSLDRGIKCFHNQFIEGYPKNINKYIKQ